MPRPKNKKPSVELQAIFDILKGLAEEKVLLVNAPGAVLVVHSVRFSRNADAVPTGIIFDC